MVVVAGNIGVGKTSLTERIGSRLGWKTAYESVDNNPYLSDFYADMHKWAFHLQIFFLGHRAEQYLKHAEMQASAILDRSIYEDAYIFARALYNMGNLNERDYFSYLKVFQILVDKLPPPDLLVYLKAPVPILMDRIQKRARNMETGISADYLQLLESYYDDWLLNFDICPVLLIRSDGLDFVHKPEHLNIVVQRIQDKLAGREEVIFS